MNRYGAITDASARHPPRSLSKTCAAWEPAKVERRETNASRESKPAWHQYWQRRQNEASWAHGESAV
jgi:hypothetical protein